MQVRTNTYTSKLEPHFAVQQVACFVVFSISKIFLYFLFIFVFRYLQIYFLPRIRSFDYIHLYKTNNETNYPQILPFVHK